MAFSYDKKTGNGYQTAFTFSFEGQDSGYIRPEDVVVTVDGVSTPFLLTSSNTLEFSNPPSMGAVIYIRRVMPKNLPYADFKRGNNFGQEVLNNSFLQLLYVVHELLDGFLLDGYEIQESLTVNGDLTVKGEGTVSESDPDNPKSIINFEKGDERYRAPLLQTIQDYQEAIANIQAQLTGNVPLEASAFSPISWHKQEIENSVAIPDGKNAWSFGPELTIAQGQSVTIGAGSYWTVANGEGVNVNASYDGGVL